MTPTVLRAFAILIALVAAIDPAITSTRNTKPEIAVVAADARDSALAARVARELARRYTIVRAPFARAAGSVIVGDRLPPHAAELAVPVFAVTHDEPGVAIERIQTPPRAPRDARVPVNAIVRTRGARGRLDVTLRAGNLVIDRVSQAVSADSATVRVPLTFVPTATGTASLRVTAELGGARSDADVAMHVDEQRWGVLFFDRRPSWMSTFVRRSLEGDPRFVVTSRIVTSRDVTTDAGRPPLSLAEYTPLAAFDAVVVGAPDALTARDVDGLDAFMRRRGGSVVLLFDRRAPGPYERLTSVTTWSSTPDGARADAIVGGPSNADSSGLRAGELSWPSQLPLGAHAIGTATGRPVIWKSPIGSGTLVVSGAQDAWKFRGATFDSFWQATVGEAAASAPALLDVGVDAHIVAPGEPIGVNVTLRDVALSREPPLRASLSATLESDSMRTPVQVWPDGAIGRLRGVVRAPTRTGTYNIVVTNAGARAERRVIVMETAAHVTPDDRDVVAAFAHSRGGVVAPSSELSSVVSALDRAVTHQSRRETWYPMRSAWWIVPFALLLGAEWWWRRRRGHA